MKKMERLFKAKKMAVSKVNKIGSDLDELIMERWGFNFSETDDDPIIDTLDYGTSFISFDEFERRMNEYKSNFDNDNRKFGTI
jgi:hypothetical protein